jgi:DNA-binding NarL/FixJ family response regulator
MGAMNTGQRAASILIASGRTMTCELISHAFERPVGSRVVATSTSAKEAIEAIRTKDVNLVLVTTALAEGPESGIVLLREIQKSFPLVKTVLLFERSEGHQIEAAFRAGAKGVLSLSDAGFALVRKCVEKVHAGEVWANSAQLAQVLSALCQQTRFPVMNAEGARLLTKREGDIVRLVEEGRTNRQIARELDLSEHTIRNYLFRIFEKLGVSTRVELALYAVNGSRRKVTPASTSMTKDAGCSRKAGRNC